MPLTLIIRNVRELDNGSPVSLVLDRRGAMIGRAATVDWALPDPTLHISSRHCEIRFADNRYELIDHSTNGTFMAGQSARLAAPHVLAQGDVFVVGRFEIAAALDEASAAVAAERNAAPPPPEWQGWDAAAGTGGLSPAAETSASGWGAPPPSSAISGAGPMSEAWAPPQAAAASASGWSAPAEPAAPPTSSVWQGAPPPPSSQASEWSSPAAAPTAPVADDIWGKFAASNTVDWARGGFGASPPPSPIPAQAPGAPAFGGESLSGAGPISAAAASPMATAAAPRQAAAPAPPAALASAATGGGGGAAALLAGAGLQPTQMKVGDDEALAAAGTLLRRLIAGLVVLLEARARAKSQMGAQGTSLEFDGNNPLKFARAPEQALAQLLNPPERGFMSSDRAVEDAFKDLQAHQMATLRAMQGALRATLDRFSPRSIRARADNRGILSKLLPSSRDAALWKAYEREFGGVAQGSDEAFMDVFAKEFRKAYDEIAKR